MIEEDKEENEERPVVGRMTGRRTSMNDYVERALKQRKEGK